MTPQCISLIKSCSRPENYFRGTSGEKKRLRKAVLECFIIAANPFSCSLLVFIILSQHTPSCLHCPISPASALYLCPFTLAGWQVHAALM
ncbi:hypothetical protein AB205_0212340 [Aquarana catesbeiana]|uniref:Uncharacterized protein n=1 Tax=Aquarana catesbeiana TaxID=8400 RepID=A0A2G9PBF8_AQUCT|nr:hypothetical protein AB205_0212340 [Aquarana catesbeiana]